MWLAVIAYGKMEWLIPEAIALDGTSLALSYWSEKQGLYMDEFCSSTQNEGSKIFL